MAYRLSFYRWQKLYLKNIRIRRDFPGLPCILGSVNVGTSSANRHLPILSLNFATTRQANFTLYSAMKAQIVEQK